MGPASSVFRSRTLITVGVVLLSVSLIANVVVAGQVEGGIIGQVTDESGAILPGVTVTASSPALQVAQVTSVSDERGEYRLSPLPIGMYTVMYELSGFQSVRREGLRLTVGFVAKVDVVLKVGGVEETVTVSGASPVVDVTSTTATTQFTRETLELTPTARNSIASLLVQAPGVRTTFDVGGSAINSPAQSSAFGQGGAPWYTLEGVYTAAATLPGQNGVYWDYSVIEEARVQAISGDAEALTRGVQVNAVVKSGGNDFHGSGFFAFTNQSFQSSNIDAALRAQGINSGGKLNRRDDYSGDLGGRFIRNKLWFYTAGRWRTDDPQVLGGFKNDGSPANSPYRVYYLTEKIAYQVNPSHRLVTFTQYQNKKLTSNIGNLATWDSRNISIVPSITTKGEWQAIHGNSLVASLQHGFWQFRSNWYGQTDKPATTDLFTLRVDGDSLTDGERVFDRKHHTKGSLTWYRPDRFGNHEVKTGFDFLATSASRGTISRGVRGDYQLVFNNGQPFQLNAFNYPTTPLDRTNYLGLFVKDSWTVARRLTLDLGIRYAHNTGWVPAACREAGVFAAAACFPEARFPVFNTVAPRLHAAYDITGDGKTVIKGGWGLFDHMYIAVDEISPADQNVKTTTNYDWHDLNGDRDYDPGEVDLDPNGSDINTRTATYLGTSLGSVTIPNPNIKRPRDDEFSATLERQLVDNVGLRLTGVYRRAFNIYRLQYTHRPYAAYSVAVTNPDPGPDGRPGTADDPGTSITYFEYPTTLRGVQFDEGMLINDRNADQNYKSLELAAFKRLSDRWQGSISYSATRKHIPFVGVTSDIANNVLVLPSNPNNDINTTDDTWLTTFRVSGAYVFPIDLTLSANFQSLSGQPYGRTALFTGGSSIRSQTLFVEPLGTRMLPTRNVLDFRVEKGFRLQGSHKALARLNIYNALNSNTALAVGRQSGPNFLVPSSIMPPRLMELSLSYVF